MADTGLFTYSSWDLQETIASPSTPSQFDVKLQNAWERAMREGYFNYTLGVNQECKVLPGQKRYIILLNNNRFMKRREPTRFSNIAESFNRDAFNFTKIRDCEVLFDLQRTNPDDLERNGALDLVDDSQYREKTGVKNVEADISSVIINVSPFEYCHILLVPDRHLFLPQRLTEGSIRLAIEVVLMSTCKGFRVAYNSLGALASVNHLHLHAYYRPHKFYLEDCAVEPLVQGVCHELSQWPAPAFVFQLHGSRIDTLSRKVHLVLEYLVANGVAHNMFVTRGKSFQHNSTLPQSTVRLYIWPRKSYVCGDDHRLFNIASVELAGNIPCKDSEGYHNLTEENIDQVLSEVRLNDDRYATIKKDIVQLLTENSGYKHV